MKSKAKDFTGATGRFASFTEPDTLATPSVLSSPPMTNLKFLDDAKSLAGKLGRGQ